MTRHYHKIERGHNAAPIIHADLEGGGPYDGRRIDRRGDLPEEVVMIWPQYYAPFGPPNLGPRYCTYARVPGTNRYRFKGTDK
jgi:hypothetical protein